MKKLNERWLETTGYSNPSAHERSPTYKRMRKLLQQEYEAQRKYERHLADWKEYPKLAKEKKWSTPVEPTPDPELEEFKDNHNMFLDFIWNLDDPENTYFKSFKRPLDLGSSISIPKKQNRLMHGDFKWRFPYDASPGLGCKGKILYLDALVASFFANPTLYETKLNERVEFDPEVARPKTIYEKCRLELRNRRIANKAASAEMRPFEDLEEKLIENTEALLDEATELEREHIKDALSLPPEELAFNELFEGKLRLVIDYKPLDPSTKLGRFYIMWQRMDYKVDWEKGIVSGVHEVVDESPEGAAKRLKNVVFGQSADVPRTKKIQMKIGKWLSKVHDYAWKIDTERDKILKYMESISDHPAEAGRIKGTYVDEALTEKERENYYRNRSLLSTMTGGEDQGLERPATVLAWMDWWKDNAAFIKTKMKSAGVDGYAIIITRAPIDVWRMADFDNIESCHSPPSRGGGGEYYKCGVAEAHGHGAVAYVVNSTDLIDTYVGSGRSKKGHLYDIKDVENSEEFQDPKREIFEDDKSEPPRQGDGEILPMSRVRLRQVRYFENKDARDNIYDYPDNEEMMEKYGPGTELAVPEFRVYGTEFPDLSLHMIEWARKKQQTKIENAPRIASRYDGPPVINGDTFIKYGGSHEDNVIDTLVKALFGGEEHVTGLIKQDTETEDQLDEDLLSNALIEAYQSEVDNIAEEANDDMRNAKVAGFAISDDGGFVYITLRAQMHIYWYIQDFKSLPNPRDEIIDYAVDELDDWFSWLTLEKDQKGNAINWNYPELKSDGKNVVLTLSINPKRLKGFGKQEYSFNPDSFGDFCTFVEDECEPQAAAIKHLVSIFFKRNGIMHGGAIIKMAQDLEDGNLRELGLDYWEHEVVEGDEYGEISEITFESAAIPIAYADINNALVPDSNWRGVNKETAQKIAGDREFHIELRKRLAAPAQQQTGEGYYPPMWVNYKADDMHINITPTFSVYWSDPDGLVDVLGEIILYWDHLEQLVKLVNDVFLETARKLKVQPEGPTPEQIEEHKLFEIEDLARI
jgi:hypothetical protein